MEIINSFAVAASIVLVYMTLFFIIAVLIKDNSIADIAWGPGFIIVSIAVMLYHGSFGARNILLTAIIAIWGSRLSIRIFLRNVGRGEDWRYKKWRDEWGRLFFLRSYLQVFILQGAILLVNIAPVIIVHASRTYTLHLTDLLGLCVWLLGFFFESVGDHQLDRFVKNPANRGKIMDGGLWRYTRHPNYFGEITMWWGIFIIALPSPYGYFGIIGPVMITLMIVFVSGVPMTERSMEHDPAFREYKRRTSMLIPWIKRK